MELLPRKRKKRIIVWIGIGALVLIVVIGASVGATRRRSSASSATPGSFEYSYDVTWARDHVRVSNHGEQVDLMLDQASGAGFGSKERYLFGQIGIQIKLIPGDSTGTAVAYFMSSLTDDRDEFDFQFFGNGTGQPYALQTNIFVNGIGGREQRFLLWFDPAIDFHFYSVLWNQHQVIFLVDNIPIRVFKNRNDIGLVYPSSKPMGIYTNLWATGLQGGTTTLNWSHAPFVVSYRTFTIDGCRYSEQSPDDCRNSNSWWTLQQWNSQLEANLTQLKHNYMVYDYCSDTKRYTSTPLDCK